MNELKARMWALHAMVGKPEQIEDFTRESKALVDELRDAMDGLSTLCKTQAEYLRREAQKRARVN